MGGMTIEPATRRQAKGRMLLFGPSGSGKTVSALRVAQGMAKYPTSPGNGKIVLIDTENRSSEKYAGLTIDGAPVPFEFDILALDPPYSPQRYIEAMHQVAAHGADVCIIDSITHEWNGSGGVQEIVDAAKARFGGNSQAAWSVGTPLHNKFLEAILAAPYHVVATCRSKTEWVAGEDAKGRQVFHKAGYGPIQRDTIEYEFDVTMLLDAENNAQVVKTRANPHFPPLTMFEKLDEETGALFLNWLTVGADTPAPPAPTPQDEEAHARLVDQATTMLDQLQQDFGDFTEGTTWSERMHERIVEWWQTDTIDGLTDEQLTELMRRLKASRTKITQDREVGVA